MELLIWFLLAALAVDDLTHILVKKLPGIDLPVVRWVGDAIRWFQGAFPRLGKIAECPYCQSWWLSAPVAYFLVLDGWPWARFVIAWLALHRLAQFFHEFYDRYQNGAPITLYAMTRDVTEPAGKAEDKPSSQP